MVWSLQHLALPFVADGAYMSYRTGTTVPIAITAVLLYRLVLRRRLLPLVVVHWVADVFAALSPVLFVRWCCGRPSSETADRRSAEPGTARSSRS